MAPTHTTAPRLESLEGRVLPAAPIAWNPVDHVIDVQGSPGDDRLTVTYTVTHNIKVRLTGGVQDLKVFPHSLVRGVLFAGGGGNDQFVNRTRFPLLMIEPPPPAQPSADQTGLPAGPTTFQDHFIDPIGDGKSVESWSAPGKPARVSIFFDPGSLPADQVARLRDAVGALNALHTGVTLVETSNPNAQIAVDGKPASTAGVELAQTVGTAGARVGTLPNGKKVYQLTHAEIDVFQNEPWWTGAQPVPLGLDEYDFRSTMQHELGHAVGLDHDTAHYPINDGFDVMYPVSYPGVARWTYSANDIRELSLLYGGH